MDVEELRDEATRLLGWRLVAESDNIQRTAWINERYAGCPITGRTVLVTKDGEDTHPLPLTLDAVAAAMPEGWAMVRMVQRLDGWEVTAANEDDRKHFHGFGPTELHARLALLVSVLREGAPR